MSRLTLTAMAALMLASVPAAALDRGDVSNTDPRVRYYAYSPEEVYALTGYFGHVTTIFFREDEEVSTISAGDSQAWDVTVAKNKDFIFLKPVLEPARRSNLTVVTNRRTYVFDLKMGEIEDGADALPFDLTYKVRFNYADPLVTPVEEPDAAYLASLQEEQARLDAEERERWERQEAEERARQERADAAALARQEREEAEARAQLEKAQAREKARRDRMLERLRAPSVIFDETDPSEDAKANDDTGRDFTDEYRDRLVEGRSDDRVFLDDSATRRFDGAVAYQIDDLSTKVLQGSFIQGVLETAINSTLTGMIRGSVSEDVLSADAAHVLIPRGSRLIGEYRSAVQFGTSRVLVAWNRVIRPDGASIDIGSPGTDQLGQAGMTGFVDSQWATRFGAAALISVFEGAAVYALAQVDGDIQRDSAEDISSGAGENFGALLEPYANIPTTVHVDQGARVILYVARDLDFSPVEDRGGDGMIAFK